MASFTDLIAQRISLQRDEFLAGLSTHPSSDVEHALAASLESHWHTFVPEDTDTIHRTRLRVGAVDGSRAIRALNMGADWLVAQALLLGPDGLRLSAGDTRLLWGDVEHPEVDRCASLLMRSLELDLALQFAQQKAGDVLLLDGSLYADLPFLLYNLAIGGYEDLPPRVLAQYLDLFELCQKHHILLLGISKSTRSTVLGRALLNNSRSADATEIQPADVLQGREEEARMFGDTHRQPFDRPDTDVPRLPSDGELLYRWTKGYGLTDPVLLGSASFGHTSARKVAQLAIRARQALTQQELQPAALQDRVQARLSPLQERLLAAPAIGAFYARLAPGDEVLRIDALASAFGRDDLRLLEFAHTLIPHTAALPIVKYLLSDYGGRSVYNAALYVVDQEVRLHTETVDQVYLSVLRSELGYPIQYDRSTRRFFG